MTTPISNPESISRFKKARFLLAMSEDTFRDAVVRPLFLRQGLRDGRDVCGATEKGKDAIFVSVDELGSENLYAVQTKKGSLTMSRRVGDNLLEAITQLKTALGTRILRVTTHQKLFPAKVILCCSGQINDSARQHIVDEIQDARITFMDADDLIPRVDKLFAELWLGIDAELFPYFRAVKKLVEAASENAVIVDMVPGGANLDAATDSMFLPLRLYRVGVKREVRGGKASQNATFEELPVTGIVNRKERLVLIIGEAGAGKSTSMKRIAYILAEKGLSTDAKCKIPILLRATEVWAGTGRPLVDLCLESTQRVLNSTTPCFSNDDLTAGKLVLLIDALDELGDDAARSGVVTNALSFHKDYPECQIIITSRPYNYLDNSTDLNAFERFHLTPINYKQAQQLMRRLERKRGLPSEHSSEILRRLQQIHGMELNPLLVTVFAATTDYARRDIPANITELFKKFTELMLGRWDSSKGLERQYQAPLKDFLLKSIAFEMHRRRLTSLTLEEFKAAMRSELEPRGRQTDFEVLLDEILNRSGLLRVVEGRVEFRHHLLQEFFAGRGITNAESLKAVICDRWWQRPIVFYFGENPGDATAFSKITPTLSARTEVEVFSAALTLGLAIQACYLVTTLQKRDVLRWVIETIADSKMSFLKGTDPENKYPLTRFLLYYLTGRDAVACDSLATEWEAVRLTLKKDGLAQDDQDAREFWIIVGLLECGEMAQAQKAMADFRPHDMRLLLAIHLSCFLILNLKVATKEEKQIAGHIEKTIGHHVDFLRQQMITEWKTELLEFRQGQVKAIELPDAKDGPSGQPSV